MDLNPIGKHCVLESCNALDFLPIQCSCSQWFCKLHISPDLHDCSALRSHDPAELAPSPSMRSDCALAGCNKPPLPTGITAVDSAQGESHEVVSKGCPGCGLSFCVDHRHMQSHACLGLTTGKNDVKHEAARGILAQFSATGTLTSSHTPVVTRQRRDVSADPKKLAQLQKVNLMKMRHKAVPGDPKDRGSTVPVDQRIHVTVRLEISGQSANESVLWFRKATITGKVLDLIAQHFGLPHTATTLHLKHSVAENTNCILQNHLPLSAQLGDGTTVLLTDSQSDGLIGP